MRLSFALLYIGILALGMSVALLLKQGLVSLVILGAVVALLFLVVDWFLLVPIKKLQVSLKSLRAEDYTIRLPKGTSKEVQDVFGTLNDLASHLEETKERTGLINRMKSEFLSITAHQLRTPLSALKWVIRMLVEGDMGELTKQQKELLEKGYTANERMITLVNDLLDVVRIEEGRFDYKFETGSLVGMIEDIVNDVKIIAEKKGVELSLHKPSHDFPDAIFDPARLRLGVTNIIENAIQYTPSKGRVDIEITLKDEETLMLVRDTGIGIPKSDISRVFSKFFRSKNAILTQPNGSGLGLFIAKNVIEKHGGKIWVESEEGKGTTVFFTLPARR